MYILTANFIYKLPVSFCEVLCLRSYFMTLKVWFVFNVFTEK